MNLSECRDVLTLAELLAVLRIKKSLYFNLKAHGAFPIRQMQGLGGKVLYAKADVQRYLDQASEPVRRKRSA